MKSYYVYILSNKNHTVFYTGMTSNLLQRIYDHKDAQIIGFTKKYNCHNLLWFEEFDDPVTAIEYEKRIKKWSRKIKFDIITRMNPEWKDLAEDILLE